MQIKCCFGVENRSNKVYWVFLSEKKLKTRFLKSKNLCFNFSIIESLKNILFTKIDDLSFVFFKKKKLE